MPRLRHLSRSTKRNEPNTCRVELMPDENTTVITLQLFLFVSADDDAGIFLDSRGVPPSSRSVSTTDDSLRGTSRCTPSDIVYQRKAAAGSFRRCPLPSPPNWTLPTPSSGLRLVAVIRRPAFQRSSLRTDATTRRREPPSHIGQQPLSTSRCTDTSRFSLIKELCCLDPPRQPAPYSRNFSDLLVLPTLRINVVLDS